MESLVLEEPDESVVLRGTKTSKLSWKQTYLAMALQWPPRGRTGATSTSLPLTVCGDDGLPRAVRRPLRRSQPYGRK